LVLLAKRLEQDDRADRPDDGSAGGSNLPCRSPRESDSRKTTLLVIKMEDEDTQIPPPQVELQEGTDIRDRKFGRRMNGKPSAAYMSAAAQKWNDRFDDEWVRRHGLTFLAWYEPNGTPLDITDDEVRALANYIDEIRYS
jgi:hypothetical protein